MTGLVFMAAFLGGLGLALFRNPVYGLYVYMATFYAHPPSRWWGQGLPDLRWSLLAAVVTFIATMRLAQDKDRAPWYSTTPAKILIAFSVWVWLQNLWALDHDNHIEFSILYTKYIVLFYFIYRLVDSPQRVTAFLVTHMIGCAYLGYLAHGARFSGRLEGVGGPGIDEANALGMVMATATIIGATMMLQYKDWRRYLCILVIPLALNAMVLTGSRSAFLGLIGGGIGIWYLKPPHVRRMFYFFAIIGLFGAGSIAQEAFFTRMKTITAAVDDPQDMDVSAESRLVLAQAQWEMAKAHPLGIGHRGTGVLSPLYLDEKYLTVTANDPSTMSRTSHNTLLSALVEQGWPGFIMFVGLLVWAARTAVRLKKFGKSFPDSPLLLPTAGIAAALLAMQISGLFVDYLKTEPLIWFITLIAAINSLALKTERAALPHAKQPLPVVASFTGPRGITPAPAAGVSAGSSPGTIGHEAK